MFFELSHVKFLKKTTVFTRRATEKVTTMYFHSKWKLLTILRENVCHFLNLHRFDNSYFLLSLRLIKWSKSQQLKPSQNKNGQKISICTFFWLFLFLPGFNCLNSCRPPSFCNQHFRLIKVSFFSNESIWENFLWTYTVLYHKTYDILFYRIANALILKEVKEATNNLKKNVCTNFLFWQKIKKSNL